jgi:hypothetical protein
VIQFVNMSQPENKYSLPAQVEALITYLKYDTEIHEIPIEEMTLCGFLQWEAPIYLNEDVYHVMQDLEVISKLADFNDPRKIILDYWWRHDSIIAGLATEDHRSKSAFDLLKFIFGQGFGDEVIGATWYTRIPLAYTKWQRDLLSAKLPDLHEGILMESYTTQPSEIKDLCIAVEYVDYIREHDPEFWAFEKAKKKERWAQVGSTSTHLEEEKPLEGELSLVDWDAVRNIAIRFTLNVDELEQPPGEVPYEPPQWRLPSTEDFSWLNENTPETPEPEWQDTWSSASAEEAALLAELDTINWNPAQCDP